MQGWQPGAGKQHLGGAVPHTAAAATATTAAAAAATTTTAAAAAGTTVCASQGDPAGSAPYAECPRIYPDASTHAWSLEYDPAAADGVGECRVTLDGKTVTWPLPAGLKAAGLPEAAVQVVATADRAGFGAKL